MTVLEKQNLGTGFSIKAFTKGMLAIVAFYACLVSYALVSSQKTTTSDKSNLHIVEVIKNTNIKTSEEKPESIKTVERDRQPDVTNNAENSKPKGNIEENTKAEQLEKELINKDVSENTQYGTLPKISESGLTPFSTYKKSVTPPSVQPLIAIAINNFGLSKNLSDKILETLPETVTLVTSPYITNANQLLEKISKEQRELWLSIPTQTDKYPYADQGPLALLTSVSSTINDETLLKNLGKAQGYAGIALNFDDAWNTPQAKSTVNNTVDTAIKRGLGILDFNTYVSNYIEIQTAKTNAPYAKKSYQAQSISFKDAERIATDQGHAVVIIPAEPAKIDALSAWIKTLESKNIALVPVSTIADLNASSNK